MHTTKRGRIWVPGVNEDDDVDADVAKALGLFDKMTAKQRVVFAGVIAVLKTLDDKAAVRWLNENRERVRAELKAAK